MTKLRHSALLRLLVALFSFALIASACVSTEDEDADTTDGAGTATDDSSADDTAAEDDSTADDTAAEDDATDDAAEEPVALTASWRGVTEDTIYVGASMLDFALLQELGFSPSGWGDQAAVWDALIDDLNDRGGINGRMVDIISEFYSPIDAADAERVCAVLHQDNETFVNLGGFVGPAGSADPCVTGTNNTVMVGGEISSAEELAQANVAWFHTGPTTEFQTINLFNLLVQTGKTDGARVFTMGGAAAADEESFVIEQLEARGIEVVGSALIEALDGDTIAQDNELAVAFERFNASGANTLMVFGTPSASIRGAGAAGLTGEIAIWSNDSGRPRQPRCHHRRQVDRRWHARLDRPDRRGRLERPGLPGSMRRSGPGAHAGVRPPEPTRVRPRRGQLVQRLAALLPRPGDLRDHRHRCRS